MTSTFINTCKYTSSTKSLSTDLSFSSPMAPPVEIKLLNPLNLQFGYNTQLMKDLSDLAQLAECRFFSAIIAIYEEKSLSEKVLMQELLQREVVSKPI